MRVIRTSILACFLFTFQSCDPSCSYTFSIQNNLQESIDVKIYGFKFPLNKKRDTVLNILSAKKVLIGFMAGGLAPPNDFLRADANGNVDLFDSLIAIRSHDNLRSVMKFNKKADWNFVSDNYLAQYLLTIDSVDFH